jgi:hypothetical protein
MLPSFKLRVCDNVKSKTTDAMLIVVISLSIQCSVPIMILQNVKE